MAKNKQTRKQKNLQIFSWKFSGGTNGKFGHLHWGGRVRFKKDFKEEGSSDVSAGNGKCSTAGLQGKWVLGRGGTE